MLQAIVDEMYENRLQGYLIDVGTFSSGDNYKLAVYIQPTLNWQGLGWAVYKLMPYGEVYRMFSFRDDGLAVLFGRLQNRFPSTEPSYLTVYMNDDELCELKAKWPKEFLTVNLKPSSEMVAAARGRQQKRRSP